MNVEKKKARNRRYYEKHKDKILAQVKSSYEKKKKLLTPEQKIKHAEHQRQYYQENKEKILARNRDAQKEWYQENKERILQERKVWRQGMLGSLEYRFKRAIQTAKQRGISFSLTFDQFIEAAGQPCFYCGNELCSQVLEGSGLDRIDSSKGYEDGNVLPCGFRCNKIKMDDLTVEETKAAIQAILKVRYEKESKQKEAGQENN
jgi:hypothetical protein